MTHDGAQPGRSENAQIPRWILLRLVTPLVIGAALLYATRDESCSPMFGLAWILIVVHLVATLAFTRTHVLDTASFLPLMFAGGLAEHGRLDELSGLLIVAIPVVIYATLSFIGRIRAAKQSRVRPVNLAHASVAILMLLGAVVICSSSKTLVGFLVVPGLLIIPAVILWSLTSSNRDPEQPG